MKKALLFCLTICFCALIQAQTECETIAEIKQQPDKTKILYTGTAKTTFYNGTYNGLFIEDETGGILLKGYTENTKAKDWVTDSMTVTNITATWSVGSTGSAPGISVASEDKEKPQCTFDEPVNPTRITMAEFFANQAAYEGKAIVITDAEISPKENSKYYMNNGVDSVVFQPSNISAYAPAGGEMAGVYLGQQYDRFLLSSAEFTKATNFFSFSDMAAYYRGKNYEIVDASINGSVLVSYVTKYGENKTAIYAQYRGLVGMLNNGIVIIVDGETTIQAGDSIDGFYGKYTDYYKHITDKTNFKGSHFEQSADKQLNVRSSNNKVPVYADVNISDLVTSTKANNFAAQVIASRYNGELYAVGNEYFYKISYEVSNPSEDSEGFITISDSISVVCESGVDLNQHLGTVIISGVYDASVVYSKPTIIVRDEKDILVTYYAFNNIAELIAAGEPLSEKVVYGLNSEVIVNYKRTQVNSGVSNTWAFIEDETGALALDLGASNIDAVVGDKIKGLKGSFLDGYRYGTDLYHAPQYQLADGIVPEIISRGNELNVKKATLKEVIQDTLKYCSNIVEITNVGGTYQTLTDLTGTRDDYYLYDMTDPSYEMHYVPAIHTGDSIMGENLILTGLVNFNCLDGYYVVYRISVSEGTEDVALDNNQLVNVSVYSNNATLFIETECGQNLEVYTIDGQVVYATTNSSNLTEISDIQGAVIVKVNDVIYKTLVK